MRRIIHRLIHILKWTFIALLALVVVVLIAINLPPVHDFALKKGVNYFNEKTQGQLSVDEINLRLPRYIELSGVELLHKNGKEMVRFDNLEIHLTWPALFNQTIEIDHLNISGLDATIETIEENVWNFQFIIDGFAPDPTTVADTAASAWDFGIDHIQLTDNKLGYIDHQTGDSIRLDIGLLEVDMDAFSVIENTFVVDEINFENSKGLIQLGDNKEATTDTSKTILPTLGLGQIQCTAIDITYQTSEEKAPYHINLGRLSLDINEMDLANMRFDIDEVSLENSQVNLQLPPTDTTSQIAQTTETSLDIFSPIDLTIDELTLSKIDFEMIEVGQNEGTRLKDIEVALKQIIVSPNSYSLSLQKLYTTYNQELTVDNAQGELFIDRNQAKIGQFSAGAMGSHLYVDGTMTYADLGQFLETGMYSKLNLQTLEASVNHSLINPYLPEGYKVENNEIVELKAAINGPYEHIRIEKFDLKLGTSQLVMNGDIKGNEWDTRTYQVNQLKGDIYQKDLSNFLIAAGIDTSAIPPELHFNLEGRYSPSHVDGSGIVETPYGNIAFSAEDDENVEDGQIILLNATSSGLNAGAYMDMTVPLVFDLDLKAQIDLNDSLPLGQGHIHIDTLQYDNTQFHHLDIVAQMEENNYGLEVMMLDSFIVGELCAYAHIDSTISAEIEGNIEGIDFYNLGYTASDLRGTFSIDGIYEQTSTHQSFTTKISDIMFIRHSDRVDIDPISARAYLGNDSTVAHIDSEPIQLHSASNRSIAEITASITDLLGGGNKVRVDSTAYWKVDFNLTDVPEIRELLVPSLKALAPASGQIDFAANTGSISANLDIPKVVYENYRLNGFTFSANGDTANLSSTLKIDKIALDTIGIENIQFSTLTEDQLTALKLRILTDSAKINYEFNADIKADSLALADGVNLHLTPPLILNTENWNIEKENHIKKNDQGIDIANLDFSHETDSLSIWKNKDEHRVMIKATSFDLSVFAGILNLPDPILEGSLFGELALNENGSFAGNGYIENFTLAHGQFGRFEWDATKKDAQYLIKINADGEDIKLATSGKITPQNNQISNFDFDLDIREINVAAMPRIFPAVFTKGDGQLNGRIKFSGTNVQPDVEGQLNLEKVAIGLKANGGFYRMDKQTIDVTFNQVKFNNFTISDSTEQTLFVNGVITHDYFQDIRADLTVDTEEFTILNLKPEENNRIYGKLLAGSNISIKGSINSPSVEAKINVSDKTDLTYVVPESSYDEGIDEDMIEWVDFQSTIENNALLRNKTEGASNVKFVESSVDLTGALFIDQDAAFKVIVDSAAGDFLEIQGDGKIGVSYDRAGNIRLNGTYKVADGFYKMTFYDIVKRQFDFQEGSSIVWNGSPMDASVDFTALYKTRVSVANLMATGNSSSSVQSFNEQLPFEVLMMMKGDLSKPEISFSIELAQESKGAYGGAVEAKLNELKQDENELNKQVFALLVLNTFISSNPNADQNLAANQARNSASQILSQQLNNLSSEYIKGVDLNFDLQSYGGAAGEGNTDLNIDLAKTFLNDRMVVRVGSTIALEDNSTSANNQQAIMANVSVEYKLTPDGRFRFKVFSKTDMEDIVVGRITRTGAGILFQRDFDRVDQIFKSDEQLKNEATEKSE